MQFRYRLTKQKLKKIMALAGVAVVGVAMTTAVTDTPENQGHTALTDDIIDAKISSVENTPVKPIAHTADLNNSDSQSTANHNLHQNNHNHGFNQSDSRQLGFDRVLQSPVRMETISEKDEMGNYSISKIVETQFKYPLVRIVEHFSSHAQSAPRLLQRNFMVADHLVIKLNDGVDIDVLASLADSQGYQIRKTYQRSNHALVSFALDNANSLDTARAFFADHSHDIAYVEADYLRELTAVVPNDPNFFRQGHLDFVRDPDSNLSQIDNIGAWQAWERRTDALKDTGEYVLIGVIDTGIAVEHNDLINNVWQNPNEIADNGIDDDGNGFIDDIYGWDFFYDSNDPSDWGGHASHVAGIIAAEGNNGIGVSGVAWRAKLVSANIFGAGITTGADAAEATLYLTDLNVDVINASYGARNFMQVECDAIEEANQAGILFVTSAGNALRNLDLEGNDQYPAECDVANVLTVGGGSTRLHDLEDGLSNYGANAVDIIAPIGAYSTYFWDPDLPEDSYGYLEGTSMSAPMVTGAAALLMAEHPELSHLDIKALLMDTATRATPIENTSQSGMLNVARAINFDVPTREANVMSIFASSDDGNLPANAMDGDPDTRWSAFGYAETITFELDELSVLASVDIQWLKGDQRAAKFAIESSVDGLSWEVIYGGVYRDTVLEQSSGSNADFEHYPVLNVEARHLRIKGFGNTANDWNSILETRINVYEENAQIILNAPTALTAQEQNTTVVLSWEDISNGEDAYQVRRRLAGDSWITIANLPANTESYIDSTVSAGSTYEYRVRALSEGTNGPLSNSAIITLDSGTTVGDLLITGVSASSDDGNRAENTLDNNPDTRWSSLGHGEWIEFSLDGIKTISGVNIAWFKGNERYAYFSLSARTNKGNWTEIYNGTASGTTLGLETIEVDTIQADTLRYTGFGNSANNWNSITELEIRGY